MEEAINGVRVPRTADLADHPGPTIFSLNGRGGPGLLQDTLGALRSTVDALNDQFTKMASMGNYQYGERRSPAWLRADIGKAFEGMLGAQRGIVAEQV